MRGIRLDHAMRNFFCRGPLRFARLPIAALIASMLHACAPGYDQQSAEPSAAYEPAESPSVYLSPAGFKADLITPAGIHVKTNGQYKTDAQKESAANAIDRYWNEVRKCALTVVPPGDTIFSKQIIPQFPKHLSIEIADNWQVVEGPKTHRKMQAFPSLAHPGSWSTARREEEALFVTVVPELVGLGPQMAGELNVWLSGSTSNAPLDLSNTCSTVACVKFDYPNAPSQAWSDCED
ncbi:MAG: hypothetical protein Q7S58_08425 [Candidatus Binatus sp.]|uniref:hypothetical protein n=1 Tax=Candidatus Binatus sp. TaxID=2811406 RepID=UPI002718AD79|nr:hypothetical protein [Candidatus Binatus sp.]MDO8432417.1 hypothetical protein [Candidatus Binatus sp.]